jgi:hypothetical protein
VSVLGRLRAPQQDRAILAVPPLQQAGELLRANRELQAQHSYEFMGRPLAELREEARESLVGVARQYTVLSTRSSQHCQCKPVESYSVPGTEYKHAPLFMAGHQPELFHPGVWVKNFALCGLARAHGGLAINLVVDNDTLKAPALRIPALDREGKGPRHAHSVLVPFDTGGEEIPFEERHVHDEPLFASFAERVKAAAGAWGFEPLLGQLWDRTRRLSTSTPLVGERLAAARRELERDWGYANLEVPVSTVCRQNAFAWFACDLLTNLPRFHRIYNEAVHAYRRRNGLRSRNHPVPDLAVDGDWFEAPFWAWRSRPARRGRLFARRSGERIELRADKEVWPTLPSEPRAMIETWQELETCGFKVRSRALTNTLYARLLLCDLFVHGIGGGKYDELTDELMRSYFGVQPPAFMILSATVYLPFATFPVEAGDCRQLAHDLRDLRFNPQRHRDDLAPVPPAAARLLDEKQALIISNRPGTGYERYRALRRLNSELEPFFTATTAQRRGDLTACDEKLASNAVLRRRDYSFCLYPETTLRPFCAQFLK